MFLNNDFVKKSKNANIKQEVTILNDKIIFYFYCTQRYLMLGKEIPNKNQII